MKAVGEKNIDYWHGQELYKDDCHMKDELNAQLMLILLHKI